MAAACETEAKLDSIRIELNDFSLPRTRVVPLLSHAAAINEVLPIAVPSAPPSSADETQSTNDVVEFAVRKTIHDTLAALEIVKRDTKFTGVMVHDETFLCFPKIRAAVLSELVARGFDCLEIDDDELYDRFRVFATGYTHTDCVDDEDEFSALEDLLESKEPQDADLSIAVFVRGSSADGVQPRTLWVNSFTHDHATYISAEYNDFQEIPPRKLSEPDVKVIFLGGRPRQRWKPGHRRRTILATICIGNASAALRKRDQE